MLREEPREKTELRTEVIQENELRPETQNEQGTIEGIEVPNHKLKGRKIYTA